MCPAPANKGNELRRFTLVALTPLLEKNAIKTLAVDVPLVFSMSGIVVLAFAIAMVRQLWKAGVTSWPEVTLAMTIVLALPTPHAGPCLTPGANSRFYGIAAATNGSVCATAAQVSSIVRLCVAVARFHRWVDPVLVGHDEQAVWTPAHTARRGLWGTVGRKVDPTGRRPDGVPVLDVGAVKVQMRALLIDNSPMETTR